MGQDWDVTARVKGKDVPLKGSQEVAHKAFYEAATGRPAPSAEAARHFAESQAVEVTNRAHAEAYGGGGRKLVYNQTSGAYEIMTEGAEIIVGDKSAPCGLALESSPLCELCQEEKDFSKMAIQSYSESSG